VLHDFFYFFSIKLYTGLMNLVFFPPSTLVMLEVGFHNFYFYFLSMNWFRSHDPCCKFNKLTRIDLSYFLVAFSNFYYFIIQHWVDKQLDFIISFDWLFMWFSWSHNPSWNFRGWYQLTWFIFLGLFLIDFVFQFHPLATNFFFFQFHTLILKFFCVNYVT